MHDEDLGFRSAVDLAADIRSRRLSPDELTRAAVPWLEALNPGLEVVGRWHGDREVLRAVAAFERISPWAGWRSAVPA